MVDAQRMFDGSGLTKANLPSIDPAALAAYYKDHAIPVSYNAGLIAASIVVSLLGSYTTLVLLGRRTSNVGWRNIAYLITAALTMSSVGIWGELKQVDEEGC